MERFVICNVLFGIVCEFTAIKKYYREPIYFTTSLCYKMQINGRIIYVIVYP